MRRDWFRMSDGRAFTDYAPRAAVSRQTGARPKSARRLMEDIKREGLPRLAEGFCGARAGGSGPDLPGSEHVREDLPGFEHVQECDERSCVFREAPPFSFAQGIRRG